MNIGVCYVLFFVIHRLVLEAGAMPAKGGNYLERLVMFCMDGAVWAASFTHSGLWVIAKEIRIKPDCLINHVL